MPFGLLPRRLQSQVFPKQEESDKVFDFCTRGQSRVIENAGGIFCTRGAWKL